MAAARWRGDGADPAVVAARDAAVVAPAAASVTRDATGAVQLKAGGYGYGLRSSQNCAFRTIVSHTGGLPGFGSVMTWLPDYGVGIIAFGNLTYTGWGGITTTALERAGEEGGLQPRQPMPSPALIDARDEVSSLVVKWDDQPRTASPPRTSFSIRPRTAAAPRSKR